MEALIPNENSLPDRARILIVDDREDNLLSIETILENENYEIVTARSGTAALKILLHRHDFTLILMDVQMPGMNGFETASLIYQREKLKHIPIIFITAHNYNEEHLFEGYKVGAVDYIYKPIDPELLRFKVGVFAEMYQKNHQLLQHERTLKSVNASLEREIEERRMSEEKVRLLNAQLLENNRSLKATIEELDRFAYVASHDLQEPLRKILVFSDKLLNCREDGKPEDVERYMEKISKASKRMQKLINDLLTFSRKDADTIVFEPVSLNEVVTDVLSDLEIEIERKQARIRVGTLPVLMAKPSQMRQLFLNLVSNAIKFHKPGQAPVVSVYVDQANVAGSAETHPCHRIVVEDEGIGFDEKYAEEIFVVFKRLHSYHEIEGSGVGLSICKKIVDAHKGTIRAMSRPGGGARFVVELPVQQPATKRVYEKAGGLPVEE